MPMMSHIQQHSDQVVRLDGWEPDAEFPIGPQGAKPKSILICPTPAPQPFLIAGHRYLFKEPSGLHEQQVWSEVLAYEISRTLGVTVPPAFLAVGPGNGRPGVLIEFFYGYHWISQHIRFVHAIEFLQGLGYRVDLRRGSLKDNIELCRLYGVPEWRSWWARTLTFDALIGNTDRHTENWGFMVDTTHSAPAYSLAPVFDNGTSLGFIVRDGDLRVSDPAWLQRLVRNGRHHFGWVSGDKFGSQHERLCRTFRDNYIDTHSTMCSMLRLSDTRIDQLAHWCCSFSFPVPFTEARAEFVVTQLLARRNALASCLGM